MFEKHILITRPREDSEAVADQLDARGFKGFIEPMLTINPLMAPMPDFNEYGGFIFTSVNAVRVLPEAALRKIPPILPVYALAPHTSAELSDYLMDVRAVEGTGKDLEKQIHEDFKSHKVDSENPLLHFCGTDIARPIEIEGLKIEQFPVYEALKAQEFSEDCLKMIEKNAFEAVLFFSARTAETFVELARKHECEDAFSKTKALCLGDSMVKSVRALAWQDVQVAASPDRESLFKLL